MAFFGLLFAPCHKLAASLSLAALGRALEGKGVTGWGWLSFQEKSGYSVGGKYLGFTERLCALPLRGGGVKKVPGLGCHPHRMRGHERRDSGAVRGVPELPLPLHPGQPGHRPHPLWPLNPQGKSGMNPKKGNRQTGRSCSVLSLRAKVEGNQKFAIIFKFLGGSLQFFLGMFFWLFW